MPRSSRSQSAVGRRQPSRLLPGEFFARDPRVVARELLGKVLVRREGGRVLAGRVVEVEAYLGAGDAAAHAARGRTPRNAVLFGPPGHAYVYFIYGNHYCLNVSCMPEGEAGCVLFRALEPLRGLEPMASNRGTELDDSLNSLRRLTAGPGRLCQALGITRPRDNGKDMTSARSDLRLEDDGYRPPRIATSARIGITRARQRPLRFVIAGNAFVSR